MIWTIVAGVLGIAGTLVAWYFNPKGAVYRELDAIYHHLEELYALRDKALQNNDANLLTDSVSRITGLCERKALLLQRLR